MTYGNVNPNEGSTDATSTSLIRGARASDQAAWVRLVGTYGRLIYRWARKSGLQTADAADVVQEVLCSVAGGLKDFRHNRSGDSFRGWLRRIAQNKINDHFRQQRTRQDVGGHITLYEELWQVTAEPAFSVRAITVRQKDWEQRLQEAQMEFSARNWQIFWRVVVDGQEPGQVADEFGVSANVVRLVKSRVLKRLRQLWKGSRST